MDKVKQYVVWLDGFLQACGPSLNEEQTTIIREKLDGIFEHEAKNEPKPTLEELGEQYNFTVHSNQSPPFGRDEDGVLYRC